MNKPLVTLTTASTAFYSMNALADGGMVFTIVFVLPFLAAVIAFTVGLVTWFVCRNLRRSILAIFVCLAVIGTPFSLESYFTALGNGEGFFASFTGPVLILLWLMLYGIFASVIFFVVFWGFDSHDEKLETNRGRENGEVSERPAAVAARFPAEVSKRPGTDAQLRSDQLLSGQ